MDKSTLRNKESTTQVKLTEMQMKLVSLKIECGKIFFTQKISLCVMLYTFPNSHTV